MEKLEREYSYPLVLHAADLGLIFRMLYDCCSLWEVIPNHRVYKPWASLSVGQNQAIQKLNMELEQFWDAFLILHCGPKGFLGL